MVETPTDDHVELATRDIASSPDATVREIRLSRPGRGNALPTASVTDLTELFDSVTGADGDAVVLTGAGDDFCMGSDLGDLGGDAVDDPEALATSMKRLVLSVRECPLPVVAAVQGRALGTGFLLCLGADAVVAAEDATLALPEANLGIPVAGFASVLLPGVVGENRAREWLFTGKDLEATQAADAGFVTRLAAPAELDATADELLADLAGSSTGAVAALKYRMAGVTPLDGDELRTAERAAMRTAYEDGDALERIGEYL